jgi:hypothetical protein
MQIVGTVFLLFGFASSYEAVGGSTMKVGVGKVLITPKQSIWMAGYAMRNKPSEGVLIDLFAKALAFVDENGEESVLVTTDVLGLPANLSQEIAKRALEDFGLARERLMLTSSHTHCGPVLFNNLRDMYDLREEQARVVEEYTAQFPGLVLEAIRLALDDLEPCTLSWGIGEAGFGKNRREYTLDGVINRLNPIGPVDHDVPVLKVAREDGSVKAVAFGYACHNTTLDFFLLSGDYAGFAQTYVEEKVPGAVALFTMGCGGDINPLPRGTVDHVKKYGAELGQAVVSVLSASMELVPGPLEARFREIPLALSEPPSREELVRQSESDNGVVKRRAARLLQILNEKGALETTYPFPVQVWRFADSLLIAALGGESTVDYSLRLKYDFGQEKTWVISYANDVCAYIPSLRVLREGGYEGKDSMLYYGFYGPWAPTIERDILAAVHELAGR